MRDARRRKAAAAGGSARVSGVMAVPAALSESLRRATFVVVQAPEGFGKTTRVREALAAEPSVAWYDAQPWEREGFAAPLIERVRLLRPDAGRQTLALAASGAEPQRYGRMFADELAHVDAPLRIVIDDAHVLGDDFASFARALVRAMPSQVRLVVLTRTPLKVGLSEAVAAGHGALVDEAALRLDAAAVEALAHELAIPVDPARAADIAARTGGWPVAVALTLRTSSHAMLDELVAQQIEALEPAARDALDSAAVYEIVDPAIVAPHDAHVRARFERLASNGLLVARTDEGFRIQALVRETLLRRLDATALAARHARAASAYAAAGRLRPALFHLERARDPSADAAFLREHAAAAAFSGLADGVRTALGRVRAAGLDEPALVALADGLLAKIRGDDPRPFFAAARREADARGDESLAFAARLEEIESDLAHGETVDADRIDDVISRAGAHGTAARAAAATRAGWADAVAGNFEKSLARLDHVADDGGVEVRANVAPLTAYAYLALGDFEASDRVATAFVERCAGDEVARYAAALTWSARFALLRGDTPAAYDDAREAERIVRPFALRSNEAALYVTLAEAALHVGDTALARRASHRAQRFAASAWYARDAERTRMSALRIAARADALDGDPRAALAALDGGDAVALADAAAFAALADMPDDGRTASARRALESTRPFDASDAIGLWSAAELLDALDASRGRVARTRLDAGAFDGLIARRVADGHDPARPSFERMIAVRLRGEPGGQRVTATAPAIEPLTVREAEILELLVAGLTNREIAQRLVVSGRTVETHVARITGKFGVNSRARAVARAVALGLIAPPAVEE